jgi:ferrous iron transport protein B
MGKIAIAGNPNSGKTTVFNTLSGRNERVGNWAGVTVMKKEARLRRRFARHNQNTIIVDLPGAYSMKAYTNDELEATNFLQNEHIDVIINIIDASNLERSLFFTLQLVDTGIPVIVALNKSDITKRKKTKIDSKMLKEKLGVKGVHFTQATSGKGLKEIVDDALDQIIEGEYRGQKPKKKRKHQRHYFRNSEKRCKCKQNNIDR